VKPPRKPRRVLVASVLLAAALAALLGGWFVSGWADVLARERELTGKPTRDAERAGDRLAHDLRGELSRLLARETARPYFHYGNLFHDPRAVGSWSVTPSPLADGPEDVLVAGHFQLDSAGRVTTPTINDDVPELSEPTNLTGNFAFRDEVRRTLTKALTETATIVATAPKKKQQALKNQQAQVVQIDPSSYAQNAMANDVFVQQQAVGPPKQQRPPPPQQRAPDPAPSPRPARSSAEQTIPITISAFEWRTENFAGAPALVAVRHVDTPDGRLVQGFVVERKTLASWLEPRAGDSAAELTNADDPDKPEVVPGWAISTSATSAAIASSITAADGVKRGFLLRFTIVGLIAAAAFVFVIMLVARAEQLARERSQFAAAAAHELRTPLAGLQLYGDMLADGLGDPTKLSDYARRMSEEASRLGRVVSNVLGFSQLERGNLSIEVTARDLGKELLELAERAQPSLDRAGAALDLDVSPDLRASYDRDALARILGNLIDNAEKYGREAEDRTISLRAAKAKHEGVDVVEVTVTDHGPGVSDAARAKLFRAFSRGVGSDGPAGLGLGLALSRSLARAMGGELAYRPVEGGASFVLRLKSA
jgi:signal transduction histidine kinase